MDLVDHEIMTRPVRGSLVDASFRQHHAWLCRWAGRVLDDATLGEDIAAQAFCEFLRIERREPVAHPRALLKIIARRLICDHGRRAAVERRYLAEEAWWPEPASATSEDRMIVDERLRMIGAALDTLSPNARAAFLYSQIDGLTYVEIGRRLGVSTSRVQQYMVSGFRVCATVGLQ